MWESLKCGEEHDRSMMGAPSDTENPEGGLGFTAQLIPAQLKGPGMQ